MTQNTIAPDGTPLHDIPDGMTRADVANHFNGRYGTNQWFSDKTPLPPGRPPDPRAIRKGVSPLEAPHLFGPKASQFIRPELKALVGFLSIAGPDELVWVMNRLDIKPESVGATKDPQTGKIASPSDVGDKIIEAYTTAGGDTKTKVMEFINTLVVGGFMGPGLPKRVRTLLPEVSKEARDLAARGITMTPGQLYGRTINYIEEQLAKIHFSPKIARAKSIEEWNRVTLNDALREAGAAEVPKNIPTGRDAQSWAYRQLGQLYRDALSKVSVNISRDPQFDKAMTDARALYARAKNPLDPNPANLSEDATLILKDVIDNKIWGNVSRTGEVSGDQLKHIEETLRVTIDKLEGSQDYHQRHVAEILSGLRAEFKAMVTRQNPDAGAQLEKLDRGYAKYKTAEKASLASTTHGGVYTPGQRLGAIKARDESLDKGAFGRGEAYEQTEAEAAQRVLGNKLPDPGTAGGVAAIDALAGIAGGAATQHPLAALGVVGAPMAVYNPWVQKLMQAMALGREPSALGLAGAARQQGWQPVSPNPAPPLLQDPTQPQPSPLERP